MEWEEKEAQWKKLIKQNQDKFRMLKMQFQEEVSLAEEAVSVKYTVSPQTHPCI